MNMKKAIKLIPLSLLVVSFTGSAIATQTTFAIQTASVIQTTSAIQTKGEANKESTIGTAPTLKVTDNSYVEVERLLYIGELEQAAKMISELVSSVDSTIQQGLLKARIQLAQNKLDQASDTMDQLIARFPSDPELHYWLAMINGSQAQQASIFSAGAFAKKSKNGFIKTIKLDTNYVQGYQGLIQFYLGAPAIVGGSLKKAKKTAAQLLEIHRLQGLLSLVSIAREDDDEKLEAKTIKALESEFQTSATAQYVVGFYYQQKKKFDKAFLAFNKAVTIADYSEVTGESEQDFKDSKLNATYQLGRNAVFSELHVKEGIAALHEYLKADISTAMPSKHWASYRLAKLYILNAQSEQAKPILQKLSRIDHADNLENLAKKELQSL